MFCLLVIVISKLDIMTANTLKGNGDCYIIVSSFKFMIVLLLK